MGNEEWGDGDIACDGCEGGKCNQVVLKKKKCGDQDLR